MDLRRAYGLATDLIGRGKDADVSAGRGIYHRIFAAEAEIGAAGIEPVTGPDAWVEVVRHALAAYAATQHLIGTQVITTLVLPDADGNGGHARMSSYLQAWHSTPDEVLWLFMGTYEDELIYTPATGWRISRMQLQHLASDYRKLGKQSGG
jgi:hypothetical protein